MPPVFFFYRILPKYYIDNEIRIILINDFVLAMSKSKYAHFFVQKMLRYGSKDQKAQILKVMEGHVAKVCILSILLSLYSEFFQSYCVHHIFSIIRVHHILSIIRVHHIVSIICVHHIVSIILYLSYCVHHIVSNSIFIFNII